MDMASSRDHRVNEGESFLEGKLLIAMPGMADERFAQTVIYMCAHSAKGAMGCMQIMPATARWVRMTATQQSNDSPLQVNGFRQQELNIFAPSYPDPGNIGLVPPSNKYLLGPGLQMPRWSWDGLVTAPA